MNRKVGQKLKRKSAIWIICAAFAGSHLAWAGSGAPTVIAPSYPLEPEKKTAQPIRTDGFVNSPDEPPSERVVMIPRVGRGDGEWWTTLDLGWVYDNQTQSHSFASGSGGGLSGTQSAQSGYGTPLALQATLETRPPDWILSGVIGVEGSYGSTQVAAPGSSFALANYSGEDFHGFVGLRLHVLPNDWKSDLRLGADLNETVTSMTTLTADQTQIDVDFRNILLLIPRLEYRYAPIPNWAIESAVGYGIDLLSAGAGNAAAQHFRRVEISIDTLRYIVPGSAIGVGFFYADENELWSQTAPSSLTDTVNVIDFRVSLFWRKDF